VLKNWGNNVSIGSHLSDETLGNIDAQIKDFLHPEDIKDFELCLTDFIHGDHIDYTIYLNPRRKSGIKYLITGDNAFRDFNNDEKLRLEFAKRLKELLVEKGYPCSVLLHKHDCRNGCKSREIKWDFNKTEVDMEKL
jgi:hypothetical protein